MPDPRRHAAALLAVLALAAPAPALAAEPTLLAQIEDATPTPQAQPPLSEEPPEELDGDEGGDEANGQGDGDDSSTSGREADPLPETGAETWLIALLGLSLIASGSGLRLTLRRDAV